MASPVLSHVPGPHVSVAHRPDSAHRTAVSHAECERGRRSHLPRLSQRSGCLALSCLAGFLLRAGTRVNYPAMTLHVPGYRRDGRSFFYC